MVGQSRTTFTSCPCDPARRECRLLNMIWMELGADNTDHGGLGWELGTCLWSPSADKGVARNSLSQFHRRRRALHGPPKERPVFREKPG
jgi:hypothetical protein